MLRLTDGLSLLLAVAILTGTLLAPGSEAAPFVSLCALAGAAAPVLAAAPWTDRSFLRGRGIAAVSGLAAGAGLLGTLPPAGRFPALAILVASLALFAPDGSPSRRRLAAAAAASLLYAGFELLRLAGPLASFLPAAARFLSDLLGAALPRPFRRGSLHLGLPVLLWAALGALAFTARIGSSKSTGRMRWVGWIGAAIAAAIGACGVAGIPRGTRAPGRVLLAKEGLYTLEPPPEGKPEADAAGGPPFDLLKDLLEARGTPLEVVEGPIPEGRLRETRLLVLINPRRPLEGAERERIAAWVRRGGGLLALGDHTNVEGVRDVLNPLLEPFGIAFAFDSSCPDGGARVWFRGVEAFPHPLTIGLRRPGEIRTGIGASLEVRRGARPVLVGCAGFSDEGDPENPGVAFLGNLSPDPWEARGDLVLAACASPGEGHLLVLGDTLAMSDDAIPYTWPQVLRALEWLESPGPSRSLLRPALLLVLGLLLAARFAPGPGAILAAAALLAAAVGLRSAADARAWRPRLPESPRLPIAAVDLSHHPLADPDFWSNGGLDGLFRTLRRRGSFPLALGRWDREVVGRARAIVLPASARPLSGREQADLDGGLARGALVAVAVGAEDARGLGGWLGGRGLSLVPKPLGPATNASAAEGIPAPVFHEAWPWRVEGGGWRVLATVWGEPVAVEWREAGGAGGGRIVAIADSHFFSNRNLEGIRERREENVAFTRWLFDPKGRGP